MKSSVLILAVLAVILIAGGAFAFVFMDGIADIADGGNSGTFHKVADKIDQYQTSIGKGSITGMDPLLITTSLGNIRLNREIFNINTDISKYSLVTGFYPCDPTLDIITKANKEDKDFTLALCGCTHYSNPYQFYLNPSYDGWLNYLYNCALETVPSDRKIEFDDVEGFEYPIIFSKKKRM